MKVYYYPLSLSEQHIKFKMSFRANETVSVLELRKMLTEHLIEKGIIKPDEQKLLVAVSKDQSVDELPDLRMKLNNLEKGKCISVY